MRPTWRSLSPLLTGRCLKRRPAAAWSRGRLRQDSAPTRCYVATDLNQPMLDYAATRQGADAELMAAGGRAGPALRRCLVRCRLLPVRRDVFPQPGRRLRRSAPCAEAWRALRPQCLGPHRRERVCRRRQQRRRGGFCARSSAIPRPHAAWLSRYRIDSRRIDSAEGLPTSRSRRARR